MIEETPPAQRALGFRELYDRHSGEVYVAALRVTGNPADAEDVLQSVFLRVFDGKIKLDATWAPAAYLRRAAVNASIDLLRRKKSRPETELDERRDSAGAGAAIRGASAPSLRLAGSQEGTLLLKERLLAALTRLSPKNAELFVLRYLEGYSYDELAELLQVERGTIGSRLHRIRATLREDLSD
jgi:RNA polymerase sigma-70 factor (ECF subfamily)